MRKHTTCTTVENFIKYGDIIPNSTFIFIKETKKIYLKYNNVVSSVTRGVKFKVNCLNCGEEITQPENEYSAITKCPYCGTVQDIDDNIDLGILKCDDQEDESDNI